jgi:hypothetical protein
MPDPGIKETRTKIHFTLTEYLSNLDFMGTTQLYFEITINT